MNKITEFRYPFIREEVFSILSSMGEGIVISDADYKVVFMNKAAEELLGVKEKDFLGQTIWKCHKRPSIVEEATKKAETGPVFYDATCAELEKTFKLSNATVKCKKDEFRGTAMIIHDFTAEKRLQDELTATNQQLKLKQENLDFQLRVASEIQRGLLPKDIQNKHFAFWGEVHQTSRVGGDFYLYLPLPDNKVFLALGDVVGKGVPAALIMTLVMNYLSTAALEHKLPVPTLENLSQKILTIFKDEVYATVSLFALTMDTLSGETWYSGAAFEAPLLLKANGGTKLLRTSGLPLGTFKTSHYLSKKIKLNKNDRLVLFTDGVIYAQNAKGEFFGPRRWYSLIKACRRHKGKKFLTSLTRAVLKFSEAGPLKDDIAVLVVQKR